MGNTRPAAMTGLKDMVFDEEARHKKAAGLSRGFFGSAPLSTLSVEGFEPSCVNISS
jgi:hypothetical protein